jgi:hypothetical protein
MVAEHTVVDVVWICGALVLVQKISCHRMQLWKLFLIAGMRCIIQASIQYLVFPSTHQQSLEPWSLNVFCDILTFGSTCRQ